MSSGGLLQLVAVGAQDTYLTGNPNVTFFRVAYRRHTNFAIESMAQTFSGTADFGRKITTVLARTGDLVNKAYLQVDLPALTANTGKTVAWTRNLGHAMLDEVFIEIGGSIIDRHYGMWYTIYNELTQSAEKFAGYNVMIGNTAALTTQAAAIPAATLYIPLIFWFNRNPALALPLVALQYHETKMTVSFRNVADCYITSDLAPLTAIPSLQNVTLYVDYIFLDSAERTMMTQNQHEYLIEQVQSAGAESFSNSSVRVTLNLSHPCKEFIWVVQPDANVSGGANRWVDFTDAGNSGTAYAGNDPLVNAKIQIGNHDRITTRKGSYFNLVQPYNHHTRIPAVGIYAYSFALNPETHQPSGSINMSRIDNATIHMTLSTGTSPVRVYVFAVNYNIVRVVSGLAGLAFASALQFESGFKAKAVCALF